MYTSSSSTGCSSGRARVCSTPREVVLGQTQQGGAPSPFDRILGTRLAAHSIDWLSYQIDSAGAGGAVIGLSEGKVRVLRRYGTPGTWPTGSTDARPQQWWLQLRRSSTCWPAGWRRTPPSRADLVRRRPGPRGLEGDDPAGAGEGGVVVADLDADHVVAGVDGQLDQGVGVAQRAGHQLAGHPAGVVDQAHRPGLDDRLGGERARPARRLRAGDQQARRRRSGLAQHPVRQQAAADGGGQVGPQLCPGSTGCWTWRRCRQSRRTQRPGSPVISVASRAAFRVPVSGTTGKSLSANGDHTHRGSGTAAMAGRASWARYGRIGAWRRPDRGNLRAGTEEFT